MRMGTTSCRKSRRRTWAVFRKPHSSEPLWFARKMTNFTLLPWTLTSRKLNHYSSERSRQFLRQWLPMLVIATLRYDFMFLQDPQKHLFSAFFVSELDRK